MQKILFWSLNIIISSNILLYAFWFILFKLNLNIDPLSEESSTYILDTLIFFILYIIFKIILFYIIPVKKFKYFYHIFSQIMNSTKYRIRFFLKIFIMDILISCITSLILMGNIFLMPCTFVLALGGILPSYLIYYWKESTRRQPY